MQQKSKFPLRQVHLDFHTSPDIPGIGSKFSKEKFQAALKAGNVDSINVFAKCHHGVCYYPTKVGIQHPNLDFDLTGAMVEAAHEIGVRAPVYITAGWSQTDADAHPEWYKLRNMEEREAFLRGEFPAKFKPEDKKKYYEWQTLCINDGSGYAEHIYEITEEVCRRYKDLDGLFYDICSAVPCYCPVCVEGMQARGIDLNDEAQARAYSIEKRALFFDKCTEIMRKYHPDATIFFNGCANPYIPEYYTRETHYELEDLPTAWGGYDKLPIRAKFFEGMGKGVVGMTGKFHLSWGEFGGFKSKEALKYEIATMAIYGAGGSVGDHMHPDGEMDVQTYENIGYAYKYLEKIEPYCFGGTYVRNVGVCLSESRDADYGVSNLLLENQIDFGMVRDNNFEDFDTVIIGDKKVLDDAALEALKAYLAKGGKLVLMGDALVKDGKFQIDFGVRYVGPSAYDWDYIVTDIKDDSIPSTPMFCNLPAHNVEVLEGDVIARSLLPYFNRTKAHFCGHKNTPYDKDSKAIPVIVRNGNVLYFAHPIAREYKTIGSLFSRNYFMLAFKELYAGSKVRIDGLGTQGRHTLLRQPEENRYCLNMTYACPVHRGCAEIIEDILPVYNISVEVDLDEKIKNVILPLSGEKLAFVQEGKKVSFKVEKMQLHETVALEY